jgi:hypothetical protein
MNSEKKVLGIWVDHASAWIVRYHHGVETTLKIESLLEPKVKATGGSALAPVSHSNIDNRRHEHAHKFFREVISKIGDVDEFFLMGPSNAKTELKSYILKTKPLAGKLMGTVTVDQMSERQMAARVREFFHLGNDLKSIAM